MAFVVTAQIRRGAPRITSRRFRTRREAEQFARATARDRPGSNPRVRRV